MPQDTEKGHVASRASILHNFRNCMHTVVCMSGSHCFAAIHIDQTIWNCWYATTRHTTIQMGMCPLELSHTESFNGKEGRVRFPRGNHIPEKPWKIRRSHCAKEVEPADTKQWRLDKALWGAGNSEFLRLDTEARGEGHKAGEVGKAGLFKHYRDYSLEAKL